MENFTNFFESSTIHGLAYIATGRKYVRLFWILVVIAGFTGAGVLIYSSFQSWAESPVKTTIETHPITDLTFPKVTVCPPKNTYTDLNYDLMMTENMTLDNDTRKELVNFAVESLHDHFFGTVMTNLTKLEESDRYYNWYHGYAPITFPTYTRFDDLKYYMDTFALSGTISTIHFGDKFDASMVERNLRFRIGIYPPSNAKGNPNSTLHIEIEKVSLQYDKFQVDGVGYIDVEKNHILKNYTSPKRVQLTLRRKVSIANVKKEKLAMMSGFKVKWYYSGINIRPENIYSGTGPDDVYLWGFGVYTQAFVRNIFIISLYLYLCIFFSNLYYIFNIFYLMLIFNINTSFYLILILF